MNCFSLILDHREGENILPLFLTHHDYPLPSRIEGREDFRDRKNAFMAQGAHSVGISPYHKAPDVFLYRAIFCASLPSICALLFLMMLKSFENNVFKFLKNVFTIECEHTLYYSNIVDDDSVE